MGQPTVSIYINTGTEASPTWTEVTSAKTIYFAGSGTSSTTYNAVIKPASGSKVAEELWIGDSPYANGQKCTTYDGTVNTNQNVLRVYFANYGTATAPILTAYDNTSHNSTNVAILAGTTTSENKSLIKAVETTNGAPSANWCSITTGTAGGASVNDLKGDTDYVVCSSAASANSHKLFNIVAFCPYDINVGDYAVVLSVKYTWT